MLYAQANADEDAINRIVGLIYATPLAPQYWPGLLSEIAAYFGAFGAQINMLDSKSIRPLISIAHGCEWLTPDRLKRFIELSPADPRLPYVMTHPGMPHHCRQMCTEAALHASPMYKEILGPGDAEYTLGFTSPAEDGIITFGTMRNRAAGPFNQEDCGRLGLLIPHFKRALRAQRLLSQTAYTQQLAETIFDSMSIGALLVTPDMRALFVSKAADRILSTIGALRDSTGILKILTKVSRDALQHAIRRIASVSPDAPLPIPATLDIPIEGRRSIQAVVTSIGDVRAQRLLGNVVEPCALVFLGDPETPLEDLNDRLQRLFGLTATEIVVAAGVYAGKSLAEQAAERGLSPETLRSQIKAVMRKTRTANQSELAALLRSLPRWPTTPPPHAEEMLGA